MPILLQLFLTFAKIGLFTFGGGYAMLPMLEREIVNKHSWATMEELLDVKTAVSEAVTNSIVHGYADSIGTITIRCRILEGNTLDILVRDKESINDIINLLKNRYKNKAF